MINAVLLIAANKWYQIFELGVLEDYFWNKNEYIFWVNHEWSLISEFIAGFEKSNTKEAERTDIGMIDWISFSIFSR